MLGIILTPPQTQNQNTKIKTYSRCLGKVIMFWVEDDLAQKTPFYPYGSLRHLFHWFC